MDNRELDGRVALVTGSAQGIGKAIALKLAEMGCKIAVNDLPGNPLAPQTREEILKMGMEALLVPADVYSNQEMSSTVQSIIDKWGTIDILVNNAGIHKDSFVLNMPEDTWRQVLETNLNSVFFCSKLVLRYMLQQRWGRIINITSVAGIIGNVKRSNYAASKGGIIAFTRSLAAEVGARNITVNAVAPGLITTGPTEALSSLEKDTIMAGLAIKRFGTPRDVAELVGFLASDKAGYITGQVIRVDGGYT